MKYKVLLEKKAKKHLENIKPADVAKVRKKIIKLKDSFLPELDIKKIKRISKSLSFKNRWIQSSF